MLVPRRSCCVRTSGTTQSTPHSTPTREPTCAGERRTVSDQCAVPTCAREPRDAHLHGGDRPRRAHEADEGVNNF
jgi:hypothetical protein